MLDAASRNMLTQQAKLKIQGGAPLDDVLAYLRGQGGSKIDAIVVLRVAAGLGLEEAKRIVHFSSAWADVKERDEHLWDQIEGDGVVSDGTNGPEDMDVDPHREHAFRRGYVSGVYDALIGVKNKLTENEFNQLEAWIRQSLSPWTTTNLQKAVRPPPPSDPALVPGQRKHRDGPFTLS